LGNTQIVFFSLVLALGSYFISFNIALSALLLLFLDQLYPLL